MSEDQAIKHLERVVRLVLDARGLTREEEERLFRLTCDIRNFLAAREAAGRPADAILADAVRRSGFDIAPCGDCGLPVVCVPDGLPICEQCASRETNQDGDAQADG